MKKYNNRSRRIARELYWENHDKDTYECPDCGRTEDEIVGGFEVHHKNGEPMDNRPENQVGLCPLCHNLREGKKPSIEQIKNLRSGSKPQGNETKSGKPTVYLAGSMESSKSKTQHWRDCLADYYGSGAYRLPDTNQVEVNSPTEVMFSHGIGEVKGIANDDMTMVDKSDAVFAYFEKEEQVGTVTELVYAATMGKNCLAVFNDKLLSGFTTQLETRIGMATESPTYWFLINFLHGGGEWDGINGAIEMDIVGHKKEIANVFKKWDWYQKQVR